jgi:hypothetical protein
MLSKDPDFRKIKIRTAGLAGSATYWLGPDHLLVVTLDGYQERYRRIYYRDIQAVVIRRTNAWIYFAIALLGLLLLAGVLPFATGGFAAQIWGGGVVGFGLIALVVHLIVGPSCECRLVTAVQNRNLPYLNRWKNATRLLDALEVEVNRVQRPVATSSPVAEPSTAAEPTVSDSDETTPTTNP